MRGITQVISAIITISIVLSLLALLELRIRQGVMLAKEEYRSLLRIASPPTMSLTPILDECGSKGYIVARLVLSEYSLKGAEAVVYADDGKVFYRGKFSNNTVLLHIPCRGKSVIAIFGRSRLLWFYSFRFDPERYCLSGIVVTASKLLTNPCSGSQAGKEARRVSGPTIYAFWVRARLSDVITRGSVDPSSVVKEEGLVPSLLINMSSLSYTLVFPQTPIHIRYWPKPIADIYIECGAAPIGEPYPATIDARLPVCIAPYSCRYMEYHAETHYKEGGDVIKLNQSAIIEYEDATLEPIATGWLYIRDYRYTWKPRFMTSVCPSYRVDDWAKPSLVGRVPSLIRPNIGQHYEGCDEDFNYEYAGEIYSAPIDILLYPIPVSRSQNELDISITIVPVNREWRLAYTTNLGGYPVTASNETGITHQYVFAEAYLLPIHSYEKPLIPIRENVLIEPSYWDITIRALAHQTLIPPTSISPSIGRDTYSKILGGVYRINLRSMLKSSNYRGKDALLVIAIAFYTNGTKIAWPRGGPFKFGQEKSYSGCHTVVAANGIEALLHVSLLPAQVKASNCTLLLGVGECIEGGDTIAQSIRYLYLNSLFKSSYQEKWWAELNDIKQTLNLSDVGYRAGKKTLTLVRRATGTYEIVAGVCQTVGTVDTSWLELNPVCSAANLPYNS